MRSRVLTPVPASPRISLTDVTLIAVTSVAIEQTVQAMTISMSGIDFAGAILFSDQAPAPETSNDISWQEITALPSRAAYSRFMLQDLRHHVTTSHVLCVQWDGYVLNAQGWNPAFLDYDYIGAPWPHFVDGRDVGNGGFSLRSQRLLDACIALGMDEALEDIAICRTHRPVLERDFGIRFAPEMLARRFAFERHVPTGGEFGFHGVFNLVAMLDGKTLTRMIAGLEPGLLNRREHRELLRFALRRGQLGLARAIFKRMYHKDARRV